MAKRNSGKMPKIKVRSSKLEFKGRVFEVRRDEVVEPSGIEATRDWIVHPGSVVVLPVFADGRILMIRQYRHATRQYMWELVAGHKEKGESPAAGARRELLEETGYRARKLQKLLEIYPSPGMLSERMDIFLAQDLTEGTAEPEEDEEITSRICTLDEVKRWIQAGKIRDAKSVSGILYYSSFVARGRK